MAEFLLGDPDRLDIEDPVDDAEIVVDAADPIFIFQIALAGAVDCLDDLPAKPGIASRTPAS